MSIRDQQPSPPPIKKTARMYERTHVHTHTYSTHLEPHGILHGREPRGILGFQLFFWGGHAEFFEAFVGGGDFADGRQALVQIHDHRHAQSRMRPLHHLLHLSTKGWRGKGEMGLGGVEEKWEWEWAWAKKFFDKIVTRCCCCCRCSHCKNKTFRSLKITWDGQTVLRTDASTVSHAIPWTNAQGGVWGMQYEGRRTDDGEDEWSQIHGWGVTQMMIGGKESETERKQRRNRKESQDDEEEESSRRWKYEG